MAAYSAWPGARCSCMAARFPPRLLSSGPATNWCGANGVEVTSAGRRDAPWHLWALSGWGDRRRVAASHGCGGCPTAHTKRPTVQRMITYCTVALNDINDLERSGGKISPHILALVGTGAGSVRLRFNGSSVLEPLTIRRQRSEPPSPSACGRLRRKEGTPPFFARNTPPVMATAYARGVSFWIFWIFLEHGRPQRQWPVK